MRALKHLALMVCVLSFPGQALELNGRVSMLGSTARAEDGDLGHFGRASDDETTSLTSDQQSLRLMLTQVRGAFESSIHFVSRRIHRQGFETQEPTTVSDQFRLHSLAGSWHKDVDDQHRTDINYELDHASLTYNLKSVSISVGRQAVDWGSGRFWQPLNVFGAFMPTDLDTEYKAGIDSVRADWYPSDFSSLSTVVAFAPHDANSEDHGAILYRRQVGSISEFSFLAGRVVEHNIIGGSFESDWKGIGWRVESSLWQAADNARRLFWVAGIDYQFDDGTLIGAEWHYDNAGAHQQHQLTEVVTRPLYESRLQQQLSRNILAFSAQRDLTPLLKGSYLILASVVESEDDAFSLSLGQQLNLTYSLSDEAEFLLSLFIANGDGLNSLGQVQSEFGHLPNSASVRVQFYF